MHVYVTVYVYACIRIFHAFRDTNWNPKIHGAKYIYFPDMVKQYGRTNDKRAYYGSDYWLQPNLEMISICAVNIHHLTLIAHIRTKPC